MRLCNYLAGFPRDVEANRIYKRLAEGLTVVLSYTLIRLVFALRRLLLQRWRTIVNKF